MLEALSCSTLKQLIQEIIPSQIQLQRPLSLPPALGETSALARLKKLLAKNKIHRSLIGLGYSPSLTPAVIQRNILENPGWYTQYTPYQAEISQGRLEALLNFQTMVVDLTALPLANASLLDEATAAAEAMAMCRTISRKRRPRFFVAESCHPQTIAVIRGRAEPIGVQLEVGALSSLKIGPDLSGALLQYPDTEGQLLDYAPLIQKLHKAGALAVVAADLLALSLLKPPGEFGADIVVGSVQRFGLPLGYGGPHAGFMSCHTRYKRQMPGRIIGVSKDREGQPAYRLALQTREQHIRRDRATSNICTAQVLLAIMASFYGIYHGPEGLQRIAARIYRLRRALERGLKRLGYALEELPAFDTLKIPHPDPEKLHLRAEEQGLNLRRYPDGYVGITLDETCDLPLLDTLFGLFGDPDFEARELIEELKIPAEFQRQSPFMQHPVFNRYHSETELLRYIFQLQGKDISLAQSMIPLGSCTMKLNASTEMLPLSWPELTDLHPFAPPAQAQGYLEMMEELGAWLAEISGFEAVSFQPNAGSQGEFTGLMMIRAWHRSRGEEQREICLIPSSAHGTNPASAIMAGMKVVEVKCDQEGNIDLQDLRAKAERAGPRLAALMVTYPSTHGVFEEGILEISQIVHAQGGQIYLDGANMNAQLGLCRPGEMGADVCHLNLHKTFAIPHGGGGPGVGPVAVAAHLIPFLPGHPLSDCGGEQAIQPVAAAPYGSPSILPISSLYISMMGAEGLRESARYAILNANYMATRLKEHYPLLYTGTSGRVAHEFILDCRGFQSLGLQVDDIAKRLMDFGFHAPTMSFPVPGTLMVEPTESESKAELDRFCEAMIQIREEIYAIERGELSAAESPLRYAPHTAEAVSADLWERRYPRSQGAYPLAELRQRKYWPPVGRIDNAWGDRNLSCACPPMESLLEP